MAIIYATLVKRGLRTFESVPEHLKNDVQAILDEKD